MVLVAGPDSRACSGLSRTDGLLGGGKLRREKEVPSKIISNIFEFLLNILKLK